MKADRWIVALVVLLAVAVPAWAQPQPSNAKFTTVDITGNLSSGGLVTVTGFGAHNISASGTGVMEFRVRNPIAGTSNAASVRVGTDASTNTASLSAFSSTWTTTANFDVADGVSLIANQAGGLAAVASHASGVFKVFTGTTERLRVGTGGDVGIATGKKFLLDDVTLAGDTYFLESAANVFSLFTGGTERFRVGSTGDVGIISGQKLLLDGVALTGNTYILESAADVFSLFTGGTERWRVGSAGDVGIASGKKFYLDGVALTGDSYFLESSSNVFSLFLGGSERLNMQASAYTFYGNGGGNPQIFSSVTTAEISVGMSGNLGTGAIPGPVFKAGRNGSGNGAAGTLQLLERDGTVRYVWTDDAGDVRIHTAAPTEDNTTVAHNAGTVVGTQTSTRGSKNIFGEFTDYAGALQFLLQAKIWNFDYKSGAYSGQQFVGIVTDDDPVFGMDLGRSFNPVSAFGYTVGAIKELERRVRALEGAK